MQNYVGLGSGLEVVRERRLRERARPQADPDRTPPDSIESAATQATFDGAWKKAKIPEADYLKSFADADAAYARVLQALISQLKTAGTSSH